MRRFVCGTVLVLMLALAGRAAGAPCAGEAVVTIVGDNRSADPSVALTVSGVRIDGAGACDPGPAGLATSYAETVACDGTAASRCGRIEGLAPGVWVHRVSATVTGSALQRQAQRGVVLARATGVSNVVDWTIFGRTFVVTQATRANLRAAFDGARAYTASEPFPALVRFDPATFPGAAAPVSVPLQTSPSCLLDTCAVDQRQTAYCFDGEDVTVDALDDLGRPGGVVLGVATCNNSALRVYGRDHVLRGLVLQGSQDPAPAVAVDTIALSGVASSGTRLEACTVVGPTLGDAVSVEGDPGTPGGEAAGETVIVDTEIRGAPDKGLKVDFGGVLRLERSCVHDNANGGLQTTLGGTVTAIENVIQHNVGGPAGNGVFVGVPNPEDSQFPNALTTRGNVVRFNGARGISVVNNAVAALADDVVTNNYRAGLRVVKEIAAVTTAAVVRGGTFACNYAPGTCLSTGDACRVDDECALQVCTMGGTVAGVGVAVNMDCPPEDGACAMSVDLGLGGDESGRNAVTLNANPAALPPNDGINASSTLVAGTPLPAAGNQWQHCDVPDPDPVNPNKCHVAQVATLDVRLGPGADAFALGTPTGPRHGPGPGVTAISPARPRAGDLVRVYGGTFNAIDGVACDAALPADPCGMESPETVAKNANLAQGNQVTITFGGTSLAADVHQVTPTMLVFEMPVDCEAPGTLMVTRGNDPGASVPFCDPGGCAEREPGALCDDDDVCTFGEVCLPDGTCGGGTPLVCSGQCLTGACDAAIGCVPEAPGTACEDGSACTVGDECSGDGACTAGTAPSCAGACLTGTCDPATGCLPAPDSTTCSDGDACTDGDHCTGAADVCVGTPVSCDDGEECTTDGCAPATGCAHVPAEDGTPCAGADACHAPSACAAGDCVPGASISCDDGRACTVDTCDPATGCEHEPAVALAGVFCHLTELRELVATLPAKPARLARALGARLDTIEARVGVAEGTGGAKARARKARRARRAVERFGVAVRRANGLDADLRDAFAVEGDAARAAITTYFGL